MAASHSQPYSLGQPSSRSPTGGYDFSGCFNDWVWPGGPHSAASTSQVGRGGAGPTGAGRQCRNKNTVIERCRLAAVRRGATHHAKHSGLGRKSIGPSHALPRAAGGGSRRSGRARSCFAPRAPSGDLDFPGGLQKIEKTRQRRRAGPAPPRTDTPSGSPALPYTLAYAPATPHPGLEGPCQAMPGCANESTPTSSPSQQPQKGGARAGAGGIRTRGNW